MMISELEKALPGDRDEIVSLMHCVVEHLNQIGIPQWDERYPRASDVDEDLRKGQLYIVRAGRKIAGIITLNRESDPEYENGDWLYRGPDYVVVHRLCVAPDMQGRGIGTRIMQMAEEMLSENGVKSVRLDAFSQNPHSLRLYGKLGYRIAGEALWRKGLFYLMEKDISSESRQYRKGAIG
ncbi:MAG: GNAT family N-acetyltransferase [Clostridiales bacterium]|nr:GNAT family N-acetyltransferase [Clostridiales bacterium]